MVVRLRRVAGLEGRANDALFSPAAVPPSGSQHALIFFGGDVQDYPEEMQAHRDNRHYLKWNLENTARILGRSFPDKHIVVVRPSRIEYKIISCYDNFVPCNSTGIPDHTPTHNSLRHLERLLQSVSSRLISMPASELLEAMSASLPEDIDIEDLHKTSVHQASTAETSQPTDATTEHTPEKDPLWWRKELRLDEAQLTLVGFSKGCVVLNQLIYEFHYTMTLTPGDANAMRFIERVVGMWWLDGGHSGGKNTWITARSLLETLARLDLEIQVHVSPYQVQDEGRPWIGREEKAFTALLRKLGAKINRRIHTTPGLHSLHTHFNVLNCFSREEPP